MRKNDPFSGFLHICGKNDFKRRVCDQFISTWRCTKSSMPCVDDKWPDLNTNYLIYGNELAENKLFEFSTHLAPLLLLDPSCSWSVPLRKIKKNVLLGALLGPDFSKILLAGALLRSIFHEIFVLQKMLAFRSSKLNFRSSIFEVRCSN